MAIKVTVTASSHWAGALVNGNECVFTIGAWRYSIRPVYGVSDDSSSDAEGVRMQSYETHMDKFIRP